MATRRERVVLELEDNFSGPMVKAAGATALLKRELNDLSGNAVKGTSRDLDKAGKSAEDTAKKVDKVGKSSENSAKQIDRLSGRMHLLAEAALVLGPALLPIGAAAVPAVLGLAAGLGAAAAAAGVAVLAFKGVGDALKALDAYQLEPTAANLEKMQTEMDKLGPAGQEMVRTLDSLEPALSQLQESAREGLFPGVEQGISSLMTMLPEVQRIVSSIATEMGHLAAEAGKGLSGAGFADFFHYIETDAAPTLEAFAHTVGNVAQGFGSLIVAFAPVTRSFSSGMESMSASFADWAANLSKTNGFHEFVAYIQESGPKVLALIGSLADAFVGIAKAAAPVGNAVLPALTGLAKVLGAIADSPIGPPLYTAAAGMLVLNRATLVTEATMKRFGVSAAAASTNAGKLGKALQAAGLVFAGLTVVDSVQKQFDGLDTSVGSLQNQLLSLSTAGVGTKLSGEFGDLGDAFDRLADPNKAQAFQDKLNGWLGTSDSKFDEFTAKVKETDAALAGLVQDRGAEAAQQAFEALARTMGWSSSEQQKYLAMLPQYKAALNASATATDKAASATSGLSSVLAAADAKIHQARQGALTTAQGFMKFSDSLGNAKVSLGQWLAELRKQAQALQNFTANAQRAARRGLDEGLIKSLQEAGPVGAMRMRQLANATDSELARANRSWRLGQQAVRQYVNTVGGVPTAKATTLSVHDLATMKARAIKAELASIDRNIDIYINAHTSRLPNAGGMGPQIGSADGSTVPKTGLPYADRHPYLLADGEEVVSNRNGQADRWRPLLKAINANRLAGGGTAGGSTFRNFTATDGIDALNRTAKDLADTQKKQNENLKHEADTRKKMLERELQRDNHEGERDKKRHDALVQELQDLKDQRRQLVESVSSQFKTDIFSQGGIDLAQYASQHGFGGGFGNQVYDYAMKQGLEPGHGYRFDDWVQQYLDTLAPDQLSGLQVQAGIGTLNQDASNADAFERALKKAKHRGLSGGLLHQLEASGNLAMAQQFATMSADQISQYEKAYKNRSYEAAQTARMVGNDKYGAAIVAQTKLAEHANRILERAEAHAKENTQSLHRLEKRIDHLNKTQENAPKKTGDAVAGAINGAVSHGQRSGK